MAAPSRGSILSPNVGQRKGADLRGRQNRAALLQCVRESAPVSRRGLSEETGIRPNTVGVIVAELIEEGILVDVGEVVGRRGRRRRLLDFAPQSHVLGAEIFEGAVRVGAMDLRGEIRDFEERPLESHDRETVLEI
ncbi:hypothetical protein JXA47_01195, partial [Candidatus Sumerlaeota bacterium]|nr:hypothetical protein [Candidatus Sumerlaeota bacterium]